MAGRIHVGTASWTDPSLIACKRFYPKGCTSADARLRFYASQFTMVEVDSSWYALPSATNAEKWAERTPSDFTFNVKAFRLFTGHHTSAKVLPPAIAAQLQGHFAKHKHIYYRDMPLELLNELWRYFINGIRPLQRAGKLGAVHFQFAPWFVPGRPAYAHLQEIRERLHDFDVSTEFRHSRWFDERQRDVTLAFERQLQVTHVVLDMPQGFKNSVPQVWDVTTPERAIVRLHGRNADTWDIKGATSASERFDYDYSDDELREFVGPVRALADKAKLVQIVLNNNAEDEAQRNGRTLMELLGADAAYPEPTASLF